MTPELQNLRNTFTKRDPSTGVCTRKEMRFQVEKDLIKGYSPTSLMRPLNIGKLVSTASSIFIKQEEMSYLRFSDACQNTLIKFLHLLRKKAWSH